MAVSSYDVIIVGAGHNGLVAAAYIARGGKSVLVLERSPVVGGTAVTEEIAPGFRCSLCFQSAESLDATIIHELALERHGLRFLPGGGLFVPSPEGQHLLLGGGNDGGGSAAGHAGLSASDAEALHEFESFLTRLTSVLRPVFRAPLPELGALSAHDKLDLLRLGWRLRRMGREPMQEALRFLTMPVADVVEERFESELLRAAVAASGIRAGPLGPLAAGTAYVLLHHAGGLPGRCFGAPLFVRGGMGALSDAIEAAALEAGAEVRTETEVSRVDVQEGRAVGVLLENGEEIAGRVVASSADPRRTLLELVGAGELEPEFIRAVGNLRAQASVALVLFTLDGLPQFTRVPDGASAAATGALSHLPGSSSHPTGALAHLAGRIQIGHRVEDLERAADAAKHGELPARPFIELTIPSLVDPSLAPEGKHVAAAQAIETALVSVTGRQLIFNLDGAMAALLGDIGFPIGLANALFMIGRLAGIAVHAYEEQTQQRPNRHIHPTDHGYDGPALRHLESST